MIDLWPDNVDKPTIKAPVSILREQATLLGQKTNNVVEATVERVESVWWASVDELKYAFLIVAPLLQGYRYRLFIMAHSLEFYPIKMVLETNIYREILQKESEFPREKDIFLIHPQEEFLKILGMIFGASKTIKVIHSLIAQSGSQDKS